MSKIQGMIKTVFVVIVAIPAIAVGISDSHLVVKDGTVHRTAFSSYRFKLESLKEEYVQLSEFVLFCDGENVTRPYKSIAYDSLYDSEGITPLTFNSDQSPSKIVDGKLYTKWLDSRLMKNRSDTDHERVWLRIDYDSPKMVNAYAWYTANDRTNRDPTAWRLQGSNDGGATWTDLDVQSDVTPTESRYALVGPYFITPTRVVVESGATVQIGGISSGFEAIDNFGTLELLADSTLSSDYACWNGTIAGAGGIEVANGATTIFGNQSYKGGTRVAAGGVLNVGAAARYPKRVFDGKYFRLTIKRTLKKVVDGIQFSEFHLYDVNGATQNIGLVENTVGTSAYNLAPGSFVSTPGYLSNSNQGVVNLFDGETSTKLYCWKSPNYGVESNNLTIVMRLNDSANPIASYNFFMGNDRPERSPVEWTLEGSLDGIFWTVLDERFWAPAANTSTESLYQYKPYNNGISFRLGTEAYPTFAGKYLRFTFTRTSGNQDLLQIAEMMLFDVLGKNIATGLSEAEVGLAATELAAGQYSMNEELYTNNGYYPRYLFDEDVSVKYCEGKLNEKSVVLTMRLKDDMHPVNGYIFVAAGDRVDRMPADWTVEGSFDGEEWSMLDDRKNVDTPTIFYGAMNGGLPFPFSSLGDASLPTEGAVMVDAGGILNLNSEGVSIGKLRVDCTAGGGTINSFCPAANGVLELVNVQIGDLAGYEIPITVSNVQNADNLDSWNVMVDGDLKPFRVRIMNGKLTLAVRGLVIVIH